MSKAVSPIGATADVTTLGGATLDLFARLNLPVTLCAGQRSLSLSLGGKVHLLELLERCGGGASNVAVGFARLGARARFCGVVGSDAWGEIILANLRKEKVDTEAITIVEGEVSSFSLVLLEKTSGERVVLHAPGTSRHLCDAVLPTETLRHSRALYVSHLASLACGVLDDLLHLLESSSDPPLLFWNPGGQQVEAGVRDRLVHSLLSHCHLLLLNREEALMFTGESEVAPALLCLRDAGVGVVCVTDGPRGVMALSGENAYVCDASAVHVIDATGAGDAFGVGMAWGLLAGRPLQVALQLGTINATSVVQVVGAQPGLLTDIEILRRLASDPPRCRPLSLSPRHV